MDTTHNQLARRLREARESLGLTQAEVAEELDVHRPTISEIEAGRRAVRSVELYRLSRLFAIPVADLLRETPLEPPEVERALFRRQGVDTPATRRAVRRFLERCRTEKELEDLLGWAAPGIERRSYEFQRPTGTWDAIQQGEWMANRERRRLGLGSRPVRDAIDLIRREGIRVGPLEVEPEDELDGVFFEAGDLGACIGLAPQDPYTGYRSVFTAVHEYAHWLLGDVRAEGFRFRGNGGDEIEVRANSFAAAFLMPEEGLREYFDSEGLLEDDHIAALDRADIVKAMEYFGVSRLALVYRLQNRDLITGETAQRSLEDRFSVTATADVFGLQLKTPGAPTRYLNELVVEAWRRGLVSTGRAAGLLDLGIEAFRDRMNELAVEQELDDEGALLGASAEG